MEFTTTYIVSQVFVIIGYIIIATTFFIKDRKVILIVGLCSLLSFMGAFFLLSAWSGLLVCVIGAIRNIGLFFSAKQREENNINNDAITKGDLWFLAFICILTITAAFFTYQSTISMFPIIGSFLITYAFWQKNTLVYKALGIPTALLWIFYNLYIMSIFGIILEGLLLGIIIIGFTLAVMSRKLDN